MIHTVTFNPVIDLIYHVPNFKKGTTFRSKDFSMVPAGKGITVSYALSCLDEVSHAYAVISEDRLQVYQNACEERGILFHPVAGNLKMRYHTTLLDQHDRSVTHIQTKGDPVPPNLVDALIDELMNNLQNEDIVVLSGSLPEGVDPSIYAVLIDECKEYQAYVVLDTSGDALVEGAGARPFVLKINADEAGELTKRKIKKTEDAVDVIKEIRDQTFIPFVIITLGGEGMLASSQKGIWKYEIPMQDEEIVDTVGCGDAFAAGLVYAISWKKPEEDVFGWGIACATAAATHAGPSHFHKSEIKALRERIRIQRLGS
jgi:1-phosphofructokinase family hexose kinase